MRKRSVVLALAVMGFLSVVEAFAQGTWSFAERMPAHFGRSDLAATVGVDDIIYAMGGRAFGDPDVVGTVEAYNPATDTWTLKNSMPTPRINLAAATGADGRIYAIGGCLESHGYGGVKTVEVYNPATGMWTAGAPMLTARSGHKAITGADGRIYVIGGYNIEVGHLNSIEIYNPSTNTWVYGAPMQIARQQFGASLGTDGRIYVIGGSNQWRSGVMGLAEAYNPVTNTWHPLAPLPTIRDGVAVTTGPDGLIYAMGGFSFEVGHFGDITATVESYDINTNTWTRQPSMLLPEYNAASVTGPDCNVYAISGVVQVFAPVFKPKKCFR